MNIFKFIVTVALVAIFSGCASTGQNAKFVSTSSFSEHSSPKLVICRPSAIFQMARRPDIYVDGSMVTDIGSGERIEIFLGKEGAKSLEIRSRAYGTVINPGKDMLIATALSGATSMYYVLSVSFDSFGTTTEPGGFSLSSGWRLQKVTEQGLIPSCNASETRRFQPKGAY